MSSEALERAEALLAVEASSVRAPSWWFAAARSAARDVLALLAEVARLEQERDEKDAELWRWMNKPGGVNRKYGWIPKQEADELRAALAVAREREQRLREALEEIAEASTLYPATPDHFVGEPDPATLSVTQGGIGDTAGFFLPPAAATLAEPEQAERREHQCLDAPVKGTPPGSASAAADEPGETPCS